MAFLYAKQFISTRKCPVFLGRGSGRTGKGARPEGMQCARLIELYSVLIDKRVRGGIHLSAPEMPPQDCLRDTDNQKTKQKTQNKTIQKRDSRGAEPFLNSILFTKC